VEALAASGPRNIVVNGCVANGATPHRGSAGGVGALRTSSRPVLHADHEHFAVTALVVVMVPAPNAVS
jgi:hypothetical protein